MYIFKIQKRRSIIIKKNLQKVVVKKTKRHHTFFLHYLNIVILIKIRGIILQIMILIDLKAVSFININ